MFHEATQKELETTCNGLTVISSRTRKRLTVFIGNFMKSNHIEEFAFHLFQLVKAACHEKFIDYNNSLKTVFFCHGDEVLFTYAFFEVQFAARNLCKRVPTTVVTKLSELNVRVSVKPF